MRRKTGPVQQWVDSIPSPTKSTPEAQSELEENPTPPLTPVSSRAGAFVKPTMTISTPISVPGSPVVTKTGVSSPISHSRLARDPSFQSDSSHCSSVESLLELRRADPEAVLLGLGFGGCSHSLQENGPLARIPKRFLQPSKLQGITINDFVKHEQETGESLDSASLGYRGLTGSPYVAPSEIVQKIMERLREHESHEQDPYILHNSNTEPYSPIFQDTSRLSVLSPDNRQFLERPRSKSPDMRNKRMIIGQKSFAFGCDGDLIEIDSLDRQESETSSTNGNTDNHEVEDKFLFGEPTLNLNLARAHRDNSDTKSAMSKLRTETGLPEQSAIDDGEQDSFPDRISHSDELVASRGPRDSEVGQLWRSRREDSEDDGGASSNNRRSSHDSWDTKKVPWARLSRETGRRYSDGSMRQESGLHNRRKSLKRQSRISDVEARRYCETDSPSDETSVLNEKPEEDAEIAANADKCESNDETDRRINRSDRLSRIDVEETSIEPTGEQLSSLSIDIPVENGGPSTKNVEVRGSPTKNRGKKRHGLSSVLGLYSSAMSVRMEPGF